jgi:hypothetical protein
MFLLCEVYFLLHVNKHFDTLKSKSIHQNKFPQALCVKFNAYSFLALYLQLYQWYFCRFHIFSFLSIKDSAIKSVDCKLFTSISSTIFIFSYMPKVNFGFSLNEQYHFSISCFCLLLYLSQKQKIHILYLWIILHCFRFRQHQDHFCYSRYLCINTVGRSKWFVYVTVVYY